MRDRAAYMREYMRQRRAGITKPAVNLDMPTSSQAKVNSTAETQTTDYTSVFNRIPLWVYGLIVLCLAAGLVYIPSLAINQAINKQEDNKAPG